VTASRPRVVAWNKIDVPPALPLQPLDPVEAIAISATTGAGLDRLIAAIGTVLSAEESPRDHPQITNIRHINLLERARESLTRAVTAAGDHRPQDDGRPAPSYFRALLYWEVKAITKCN
jgi:tRNA U34 5-carboxymethylaminomethyl modifying GTPase MnmE/TrmE